MPHTPFKTRAAALALLVALAITDVIAQTPSVFGTSKKTSATMVGIFYDLKQNQAREPMRMNHKIYAATIDEFVSKGWDESVLSQYFRAGMPLYTTQLFIPLTAANTAPAAFEVDDIVKPMHWLIHYKGQVSAPTSGSWRFWGYGEEVCIVAINGKTVLVSNWKQVKTPLIGWKSPEPPGQPASSGALRAGDWIELQAGQIVDIDVLIGERGGSDFCSFLLIEKQGDSYGEIDGHPILPVFQLAPHDTPVPKRSREGPRIAQNGPVWNGVP